MKRITALLLAFAAVIGIAVPCFGGQASVQAKLYEFYGDGMVFEQNEQATLAGIAAPGSRIECVLYDSQGAEAAKGSGVTGGDGKFEVGFTAPAGGFDEYTVSVSADGNEFARLESVVFGEVWLTSGQSNMQLSLNCCSSWDSVVEGGYGSKWVRFMHGPDFPNIEGHGQLYVPDEGQDDYLGCRWISANESDVGSVSAVGYFFADELFKQINMPVGILAVYLGGSPIRSWISRQSLEGSADAMKVLKRHKQYISSSDWEPEKQNYCDLGSNYNAKIYPLRRFRISGVAWYQGETDLLNTYSYGEYGTMFDLLQQDLTDNFGYSGASLPIVYTQLACFNYRMDSRDLQSFNAEYVDIQRKSAESRAVTSISDVSLDFVPEWGSIHPSVKEPVGRRLAQAAGGLVYDLGAPYTAASCKSAIIDGEYIYVTLDNVGDGIVSTSDVLYEFAVCGKDGVYYPAEAEIVSKDTVRVHNAGIKEPKSVTYAFSQVNSRASLWSTKGGERFMPVSPFVTDRKVSKFYYADNPWMDCEQAEQYRTGSREQYVGFFDLWDTDSCKYEISAGSAYKGTAGMRLTAQSGKFSLKETFVFEIDDEEISGGKPIKFNETSRKWRRYGALRFAVRNTSGSDISLDEVRIKLRENIWVCPDVNGSARIGSVIPADGEWHIVELDLNCLYLYGLTVLPGMPRLLLDEVYQLELRFDGQDGSSLDIDAFEFVPRAQQKPLLRAGIFTRISDSVRLLAELLSK